MRNQLKRKDKIIIFLMRWWAVGAVYFFIGWGTRLGSYTHSIDFILMLGIAIGLFNSYVVDTAVRMLYNRGPQVGYLDKTIMMKVSLRLQSVVLSTFIVFIVSMIYININKAAIVLFDLDPERVFLPGEPILFAVFYMIAYTLIDQIVQRVKRETA